MRLRVLLVAVLAGAAGLGGCATSPPAAHTSVQGLAPSRTGAATALPTASTTTSGSCWEGSLALYQDASAWRCTAANQIMDPCFTPANQPDAPQLTCASTPWAPATRLLLTQPLPLEAANSPGTGPRPVWAMELANGDRCVIGTGTVTQVGAVTLDYLCTSGALAGQIDRSHQPWIVQYQAAKSSTLRPLTVRNAWA
ncbi:MAG TPA: hypothetical protein VH112_11130 [Acidimicrobiales bacterium]|nr:hypothetical protein [Acidimicrobiales bacterium]